MSFDRDIVWQKKIGSKIYYVRDDMPRGYQAFYIGTKGNEASGQRYKIGKVVPTLAEASRIATDKALEVAGKEIHHKLI